MGKKHLQYYNKCICKTSLEIQIHIIYYLAQPNFLFIAPSSVCTFPKLGCLQLNFNVLLAKNLRCENLVIKPGEGEKGQKAIQ